MEHDDRRKVLSSQLKVSPHLNLLSSGGKSRRRGTQQMFALLTAAAIMLESRSAMRPYSTSSECGWAKGSSRIRISGGTIVSPGMKVSRRDVFISGERLSAVQAKNEYEVDAADLLVFPAPVNAHDHLLGSWAPKVGRGFYENVYEWLEALHNADDSVRTERDLNPAEDIYLLGAYKNVAAGTSAVVDHYLRMGDGFLERFPIRIFHRFGRTWTMRNETGWGGTIEEELKTAGDGRPYIIHISEGVDEETKQELRDLAKRNGVHSNSMLVHGVGFDNADLDLVAKERASVVWCASSNMFLYDRTLDVRAALARGINVCLGTDSALSGCSNIFDEARFAGALYEKLYREKLDAEVLFRMLTSNAAHALMQDGQIGCIEDGALADLLVAGAKADDPIASYLEIRPEDVDLLLIGGRPAFGDMRHRELFSRMCRAHTVVSANGTDKLIVGDPMGLLARIEKRIGHKKDLPFLPFD